MISEDAEKFLNWWFPEVPEGHFINIRLIDDRKIKEKLSPSTHFAESVDRALEVASEAGEPYGVFFGTALRLGQEGKKKGVSLLGGYWCDIDDTGAAERIGLFKPEPSVVCRTAHGFHVYWKFNDYVDAQPWEAHERILKGIALALGGDVGCTDVSRVMRLPGSMQYKDGEHHVGIVGP